MMDNRAFLRHPRTWSIVVLLVLLAGLWAGGAAGAGPRDGADLSAAVPPVLSYQGIVTVDGQPYPGPSGYFKFATVDAPTGDGTTNHWANDGTASGEPGLGVSLTVSDGLFNVLLGAAMPGMTQPITEAAFPTDTTFLRVWFSPTGAAGTYEALEPNQRIASVAYALLAEYAAHAPTNPNADTVDGFHASAMPAPFNLIPLDATAYLRVPRVVDHDNGIYYLDPASLSELNEVHGQHFGVNGIDSNSGYYAHDTDENSLNYGLHVDTVDSSGVYVENSSGSGVHVAGSGGIGLYVVNAGGHGLLVDTPGDQGVRISNSVNEGVYVSYPGGVAGVYVSQPSGDGLFVNSPTGNGLQVSNAVDDAIYVYNAADTGIKVDGAGGYGLWVQDAADTGINVDGAGGYGLWVQDSTGSAVRAENPGGSGLYVSNPTYNGVHIVSATTNGLRVETAGEDGLHVSNATGDGVEIVSAANGLVANDMDYYGVDASGDLAGGYFEDSATSTVYAYIATGTDGISSNGTKNFIQPNPTDPSQAIVYAALEGGEAGTYYRGTAQLVDGTAVVTLPEHFSLVTEEEGLTVQVTPRADCNGLYVAEVTTSRIVVKELGGGISNARFDFFINGVRAGFKDFRVLRPMAEVHPMAFREAEGLKGESHD